MRNVDTRKVDPDEAGMRLDRWFREHYPQITFGHLQKLLRSGQVRAREHIIDGVEAFPDAFPMLFDGRSFGKLLLRATDP